MQKKKKFKKKRKKEGNKIKELNAKLRKNAIFSKSIENSIKNVDIKIVTTRRQCLKWSSRPVFKIEKQFRNGVVATVKEKCRINLIEQA